MSVLPQSRDNCLAGNSRNWFFTSGIDVRHENEIRPIESRSELLLQRLCPSIAMRLKHHDDPFVLQGARGLEGGFYLSRMMTVIVDDGVRFSLQLDLESSLGSSKGLKRFCNL